MRDPTLIRHLSVILFFLLPLVTIWREACARDKDKILPLASLILGLLMLVAIILIAQWLTLLT